MTMDFRFYKAEPEPTALVQFPSFWMDVEPTFTVVALQRDADPDANTHDGFDYFGAYGDGTDIDTWSADQPVTTITKDQLPNPVAFYPAPFNEA